MSTALNNQKSWHDIASLTKATSDPLRLQILHLLQQDAFGVLELSHIFAVKQNSMSHHLKVLLQNGLVSKRREGTSLFYSRENYCVPESWQGYCDHLLEIIDDLPLSAEIAQRVEAIQQNRADNSRQFFIENTQRFETQQELIASHHLYADGMTTLLDQIHFPENATAIEVGPGKGEYLPELSKRFSQVTALDNAEEMLNEAQQLAKKQQLSNVSFYHGETQDLLASNTKVDCIVSNMVMHHLPSPANLLQHAAGLLKSKGHLLISDLCQHNQDWVKKACGDFWLGFNPAQITDWAHRAKLSEGESLYLAQRNGFQIQVRHFFKPH